VAVIGIVMLGNRLFGSPTGLVSGLLLALAPFFITYERTARSYALVVALVIWSSYFFVVELERPSSWSRAGYVLTSALAIYAHYFAAWILLIQLGTLLAVKRRAGLNRRWMATGVWIVLLCVPEVIAAFHQGTGGVSWVPSSSFGDLTHMPLALAGGGALAACLLVLGVYALVNPPKTLRGWRTWFPAAWFLVPVLLTFVFSVLIKPMFLNYYLIVAVPGIALLATVGLIGLRFHVLQVLALGILIVAAFAGIRHVDQGPSREDYRGATNYMLAHQQVGDAVVYYPAYTSTGFDYYLRLRGNAGPTVQAYQPGQSLSLNHRRLWLVIRGDLNVLPAQDRQLETAIRADHAQVGPPAHFINLSVFLFRPSN
jgi:mannosyltransferase